MEENFFNIISNELILPGVSGTHEFIHISDTHICCADALSTDAEREKAHKQEKAWEPVREGFAHHFGEPFNDSHRIPTAAAAEKIFGYVRERSPEILLMTGDILDYCHPAGFRLLSSWLDTLGCGYLYVAGNHEETYRESTFGVKLISGADSIDVYEGDNFTIAAIDNSRKVVSDECISRLEALSAKGRPIILMMHTPVCTAYNRDAMSRFGEYYLIDDRTADESGRKLIEYVLSPASHVACILCGHVHGYSVSEFAPARKQICASSGMAGFVHRLTVKGFDTPQND